MENTVLMKLEVETGLTVTERHVKMLRYADRVLIGIARKQGWGEQAPFYLFTCKTHGIVASYPQGFLKILKCPECHKQTDDHIQPSSDSPINALGLNRDNPSDTDTGVRNISEDKEE
jgi:hypothetical protein